MIKDKLGFALIIVILSLAVSGCDDPNYVEPPHYWYTIRITGLDQFYTDNGSAQIMVPVPIYKDNALLPFTTNMPQEYWKTESGYNHVFGNGKSIVFLNNYPSHGAKSISIENASFGKILSIQLNNNAINNSTPSFSRVSTSILYEIGPIGKSETNDKINSLIDKPFYPDAGTLMTNYTIWINGNNATYYTTYMYIDESLKPITPGNHTIDVYAMFDVVVGYKPWGSTMGDNYLFFIHESIPRVLMVIYR